MLTDVTRRHAELYRDLRDAHPRLFAACASTAARSPMPWRRKLLYPVVYGGRPRTAGRAARQALARRAPPLDAAALVARSGRGAPERLRRRGEEPPTVDRGRRRDQHAGLDPDEHPCGAERAGGRCRSTSTSTTVGHAPPRPTIRTNAGVEPARAAATGPRQRPGQRDERHQQRETCITLVDPAEAVAEQHPTMSGASPNDRDRGQRPDRRRCAASPIDRQPLRTVRPARPRAGRSSRG